MREIWKGNYNRDPMSFQLTFKRFGRMAPVLLGLLTLMFGCVGTPRRLPPGQQPTPPQQAGSGPLSCSVGQEWCNGECRDTAFFINNDQNCGRCNNSCTPVSGSCNGISCGCAGGYTPCMGSCMSSVSFISDNNNCGSCGNSCSYDESCTGGICQKRPQLLSAVNSVKPMVTPDCESANRRPSVGTMQCSLALSKLAPLCAMPIGSPTACR